MPQAFSGPRMTSLSASHCAIILVHYNNADDTLACLRALYTLPTPPAHITVVDNNSCAEALHILREGWGDICRKQGFASPLVTDATMSISPAPALLLLLPNNTGFSGGNNAALRLLLAHTKCKAFWLLNNDTEPKSDTLDTLCARLSERPDAGLCGSTLVYAHTTDQLQCAGGSSLSPFTGRTRFLHEGVSVKDSFALPVHNTERAMQYITGASLVVRREVFESIGMLPEEYFLYYEDAAFCLAAKKAGFALAWAPQSIVYHKEGGSSGAKSDRGQQAPQRSRLVDYLSLRNRVYLMRTYHPWALPIVAVSYLGVILNRIRRGQADRILLVCKAFWHGVSGKMGKPEVDV